MAGGAAPGGGGGQGGGGPGILRQLFVRLGYMVDPTSERNFLTSLTRATVGATLLSETFEHAGKMVEGVISRMALGFEKLGYMSRYTNTSVQDIRAFSYAVSQLGGDHQAAMQSMNQFYKNIRDNRGYEGLLKAMGVRTRDAQGNLLGFIEMSKQVGDFLRRYPRDVARQYAMRLGIDDETFRLLREAPELLAKYEKQLKETQAALGVNNEQLKNQGTELATAWRRFMMVMEVVGDRIAQTFGPIITRVLNGISSWVTEHGPQIDYFWMRVGKGLEVVEEWAVKAYTAIKPVIDILTEKFKQWDEDGTIGFIITQITKGFEVLVRSIKSAYQWIKDFMAYFSTSGAAKILGWGDGGPAAALTNPSGANMGVGDGAYNGGGGWWDSAKGWIRNKFGGGGGGDSGGPVGAPPIKQLTQQGRIGNVNAIISELRQAGYKDNAIAAIIGSMQTESGFKPWAHNNIRGGHTGLWQWDRTRWPKVYNWIKAQNGDPYDARWQTKAWIQEHKARPGEPLYDHPRTARGGAILRGDPSIEEAIHGVRESERFGRGEEGGRGRNARSWLPYVQKPTTDTPSTATTAAATANVIGKYDFAGAGGRPAVPLGGNTTTNNNAVSNAVTQNNKTEITVMGGSDPAATGAEVAKQQNAVNDLSLRNAKGAIR